MKTRIPRRTFLRGLGGVSIAAPFLSSVWERQLKAQTTVKQKQFIAMFTHYGCVTTKWFPAKSHGALMPSDLMATNLAALAPYTAKILMPRGMRAMNEWTQSNRGSGASAAGRGQANDPHLNVAASYFTLQPVTPSGTDPFSFDTAYKFNAKPIGPSLDHVMAAQLSPNGTPLFMRVGNRSDGSQSGISYTKTDTSPTTAATAYPGLGTPSQVWSALMGLLDKNTGGGGGGMTAATYAMNQGALVCDLVKDDLAALKRLPMSAQDLQNVTMWETLCNEMGTIITSSNVCTTPLANGIGANATNAGKTATNIASMVTDTLDGADLYSTMAVLAAMCNYNPVIFLKYPPNYNFSAIGVNADSHNLSHRLDNAGMSGSCYPNSLTLLQTIDKWYVSKFAKLVGMLDSIKTSDQSTLLDSTAAVWFNEMSDGNAHNLNNLPVIQAGGLNGYFKTGWAVNVDTGSASLSTGRSESQCAEGTTQTSNGTGQGTGTEATLANAPLNKYFYTIMNAMGMKGNAMGYPDKAGSAPVSAFGYSDKTEDFAGGYGAKSGATIHSPGEYTALKP